MTLKPSVPGLNLDNELASLLSPQAELLWWSPAWNPRDNPPIQPNDFIGLRWLEHVHNDDVHRVIRWFAQPDIDTLVYRFTSPRSGDEIVIQLTKISYCGNWLCFGQAVAGDYFQTRADGVEHN